MGADGTLTLLAKTLPLEGKQIHWLHKELGSQGTSQQTGDLLSSFEVIWTIPISTSDSKRELIQFLKRDWREEQTSRIFGGGASNVNCWLIGTVPIASSFESLTFLPTSSKT